MNNNGNMPVTPILDKTGHIKQVSDCVDYRLRMYGMTKREAFAMAAMQGMIASGICTPPQDETIHHMTSMASVSYADALLAELEKENTNG